MKTQNLYSMFFDVAKAIGQKNKYQKFFAQAFVKYDLKPFKVQKMTPSLAKKLFNGVNAKYQRGQLQTSPTSWFENERRLFIWFAVCYEEVNKVQLLQLDQEFWKKISKLFHNKDPVFLEFQYRNLIRTKGRQKWTEKQDNFLRQAVKKQKPGLWNQISKQVYFSSQQEIFKTPKQCRERWFNHLDQSKTKSQWSNKEDLKILHYILQNGTKWSKMIPILNHKRTEHQIKNRFNSITNNVFKGKKKENVQYMNKFIEDLIQGLEKNIIEDQQQDEEQNNSKRKPNQSQKSQMDQEALQQQQQQMKDLNIEKLQKIVEEDDQQNDNAMKDLKNYIKQQENFGNNHNNGLLYANSSGNTMQSSSGKVMKKASLSNCIDFENYNNNEKNKFAPSPLPFILYDAKSPMDLFISPMPGFPRIHTPGGFFDQAALFKNSFDQWKSMNQYDNEEQKSFAQEWMKIPANDLSIEYNKLINQDSTNKKTSNSIPDITISKPHSPKDNQIKKVQEKSKGKKNQKKKSNNLQVRSSVRISKRDSQ